jgi:hypothetical protein
MDTCRITVVSKYFGVNLSFGSLTSLGVQIDLAARDYHFASWIIFLIALPY